MQKAPWYPLAALIPSPAPTHLLSVPLVLHFQNVIQYAAFGVWLFSLHKMHLPFANAGSICRLLISELRKFPLYGWTMARLAIHPRTLGLVLAFANCE